MDISTVPLTAKVWTLAFGMPYVTDTISGPSECEQGRRIKVKIAITGSPGLSAHWTQKYLGKILTTVRYCSIRPSTLDSWNWSLYWGKPISSSHPTETNVSWEQTMWVPREWWQMIILRLSLYSEALGTHPPFIRKRILGAYNQWDILLPFGTARNILNKHMPVLTCHPNVVKQCGLLFLLGVDSFHC